jgi:hypothetical protein
VGALSQSESNIASNEFSPLKVNDPFIDFGFVGPLKPSKELSMIATNKSIIYVRIPSTLHRRARIRALNDGITLAKLIELALESYLVDSSPIVEEKP